jgi:hypothetical protein
VPNLPGMTGDWILSTQNIDPAGRPFNVNNVSACQGNTPPGLQQHAEQSPPQGRDRLPARRTFLGPAVGRDRRLPRRRADAGRVLGVTFAEQVDGLTGRYLRRSLLLLGLVAQVGLVLAPRPGRAGIRLGAVLGVAAHQSMLPQN